MEKFEFQGRDNTGKLVKGLREGSSHDGIAAQLISEGITPVNINLLEVPPTLVNKLKQLSGTDKVKPNEMMMFARQMYSLYRAGIPLDTAIVNLAETTSNPFFAAALRGTAQHITEGQSLANSMQNYPRVFSEFVIRLVQVGETSGKLDETFLQIAEYLDLQNTTTKRIKAVLRYPMFVITAIIIGIIVINIFVIPNFVPVFSKFSLDLPLPTKILIAISVFMRAYWFYLLLFICALIGAFRYYINTPNGREVWGKKLLKLPIFGEILLRITLARFTRTFTLTLRAGLPMTDGLQLVGNSITNIYARKMIYSIKEALEHGETLTQASANTGLFTPLVLQMMAIGERTGAMDKILQEVTGFYEREVDYDIQSLSSKIEPLILLVVAGMVLMLALGVFLPMWDLTQLSNT